MEVPSGMKFTSAGLIFTIIFLCFLVYTDTKLKETASISTLQIRYNQGVDNAIEAGMDRLVELDSGKARILNKEEAVNKFFDSLYINFDVMENKNLKNKLRGYVPVVAVVLEEGFYVYYDKTVHVDGEKQILKDFSKFYPYFYEEKGIEYYFTLTDYIRIIDKSSGEKYGGKHQDLVEIFPQSFLGIEEEYQRIRRNTIISLIMEQLSYYTTEHNKIAKHYGINYHFSLPVIPKEDWYRTIDDISLIALFQGYPYGNGITGTYNRFAVAGARISKE